MSNHRRRASRNNESVWIFYKGKTIKLDFLGFESERELRRVCQIIYRYNRGGQLSESTGYRVNEMKDGSRVLVAFELNLRKLYPNRNILSFRETEI